MSTSEFAAEYGYLRSLYETAAPGTERGERDAIAQFAALEHTFPSQIRTRSGRVVTAAESGQSAVTQMYWATLDALVLSAGSEERLSRIAEVMPRLGGEIDTATALHAIETAMRAAKASYDHTVWPEASAAAEAQIRAFEAIPVAARSEALRFVLDAAAIENAPSQVNVLLVPRLAGKEGMTVQTPAGPLVVIGTAKYAGTDLAEVVLHEATHVVDSLSSSDLFAALRTALRAAHRPAFEIEQVPHVCMFILAAQAVRLTIDPLHRDIGETGGAYGRGLEALRILVTPELAQRVAGRSIDDTVAAIVARLGARTT